MFVNNNKVLLLKTENRVCSHLLFENTSCSKSTKLTIIFYDNFIIDLLKHCQTYYNMWLKNIYSIYPNYFTDWGYLEQIQLDLTMQRLISSVNI